MTRRRSNTATAPDVPPPPPQAPAEDAPTQLPTFDPADAPPRPDDDAFPLQDPDDAPPPRDDDRVPTPSPQIVPRMGVPRRKARSIEETEDPAVVKITVGNLTQSLAIPCPPQIPILDGLVHRGEIAILAAAPGTGKTPFVSQAISTVATGADFLGRSTSPCRVLLIDVESQPQDYRTLLRRQWTALHLDADHVGRSVDLFARGVPNDPNSRELERILHCSSIKKWEWFTNVVKQGDYGLVTIDTVLTFSPFKAADEDKVRELYAVLGSIARGASRPAVLATVHLRKKDRKGQPPTLLEDPMAWTEEILGSVIWAASADVRLGLERVEDDRVAFGGYRRGSGVIVPLVLELRRDAHGDPLAWDRGASDAVGMHMLTKEQRAYFSQIPVGQDLTWKGLGLATGVTSDGTLSRLKNAAIRAGLLAHDLASRRYRRVR